MSPDKTCFMKRAALSALMVLACALVTGKPARAADSPLTTDDVRLLLIGGAEPGKMVALIEQRGISFALTSDLEKKFRDDGADDSVILALRKAATKPAASQEKPATEEPSRAAATAKPSRTAAPAEPSAPVERERSAPKGYSTEREEAERSSATESSATEGGDEPVLHRRSAGAQAPASQASSEAPSGTPSRANEPVLKTRAAAEPASAPPPLPKPSGIALKDPAPGEVDNIIREFAAKEKTFKLARDNYTYHQTNKVEELGADGEITGTYEEGWDILYDDNGTRIEKVTYAPLNSLKQLIMTEEDVNAFRSINPFVLTTDELPEYEIKYLGHVRVDEITAYVFSVRPKEIEKAHQYFQGTIWVDDRDLQIVKSEGKSVGVLRKSKEENLFPRFTTYREQIDGKYWFPTFTMAEDTLYFSKGPSVHMKEIVRYSEYKQFKSKSRIVSVSPTDQPNSQPAPPKK